MKIKDLNSFAIKLSNHKRYKDALLVFNLALESGDKNALNDIGYNYELMGNIEKAKEFYNSGIAAGIPAASYNLARLYEQGVGTKIDYKKAFELYTSALKQGFSDAAIKLSKFYLHGLGVPKDDRKSLKVLKKGAALDKKHHTFSRSISCLGGHYEYGIGCKPNNRKAFKTYAKAVKQKRDGLNVYNFAQCYLFGTGTKANIKKTLELLYEAAVKNYPDAYYQLSALYNAGTYTYKGKTLPIKNDDYALFLLSEAYHYGSPKADIAIAEMSLSGDNPLNRVDICRAIEAIVAFQEDKREANSYDMENYRALKRKYPNDIDWEDIETNPELYKCHDLDYESIEC